MAEDILDCCTLGFSTVSKAGGASEFPIVQGELNPVKYLALSVNHTHA